jgi:hypothetical protein
MTSRPDPWVKVHIPPEFKLGAKGIADRCGWELRTTTDPAQFEVGVRARIEGRTDQLVVAKRAIGAAGVSLIGWEESFVWSGNDIYLQPAMRQMALTKAQELYARQERVASWAGFDLLILAALDAELPLHLRNLYPVLAGQLPGSSLWALPVDPMFHSRRTATRTLMAAEAAPELLARPADGTWGFDAGKGLGANDGMGIGPVIELGLLAEAPGVLGILSARLPGIVALLFGQFEAGRDPAGDPAELIDLFKPKLMSAPQTGPLSFPKYPSIDHEVFFEWWVTQVNELLNLSLDPARFRGPDGSYDPAAHYGFQLSLDRLVATIKGILVGARRDEYSRSILCFQALDLLKGLRLGEYVRLADPVVVREHVEALKATLPREIQSFVIPRCERAAVALEAVADGFYLKERILGDSITLRTKRGTSVAASLHRASADYINLVRDAGHTWAEKLASPGPLSLFIAHDGNLSPDLADVPFVHFVRFLADPTELTSRLD